MKNLKFFKNDDLTLFSLASLEIEVDTWEDVSTFFSLKIARTEPHILKENFFFGLVNNIFCGGKKKKISLTTLKTFKQFYFITCYLYSKNSEKYTFWKEYQYNMEVNFYVYNIIFLIDWVVLTLKPIFNVQCQTVPKKYRKHLKTTYLYKIKYLKEKNRFKTALKWIGIDILTSQFNSNLNRIFTTLIDLILNFKESKLYKNKLKVYAYLLRIK